MAAFELIWSPSFASVAVLHVIRPLVIEPNLAAQHGPPG
jgi:hypothetical protein